MKLITRDTDYAVRALCLIARRKDELVSVKELVRSLKVPGPFLRKILQVLNKEGYLHSYKGAGGGFKLAREARGISILKLIEIFQGPLVLSEHKLKKRICPEARGCALKKRLDRIESYVKAEIKKIDIASLLNREER